MGERYSCVFDIVSRAKVKLRIRLRIGLELEIELAFAQSFLVT